MSFFYRIKNDKGVSNSVSFIVIIAFVMVLLISFIDVGLYFNVKNQMTAAAENGARSAALYGGTDTIVRRTRGNKNQTPIEVINLSIPAKFKDPKMRIVQVVSTSCGFRSQDGTTETKFTRGQRIKAGDLVYCDVMYKYHGLAGKFGLFNLGETMKGKKDGALIKARGTSVSEVTIE